MGNLVGTYIQPEKSLIKQNFSKDSEAYLNELVNILMVGTYACLSMACHYDRDDIGLFGIANFCRFGSTAIGLTGSKVMDYILLRGGKVTFSNIIPPEKQDWGTPMNFLEKITERLRDLYTFALKIHDNADNTNHDPHLTDFIETELIQPIVIIIKQLAMLQTNLKLAGTGLGEYEFNKDLQRILDQFMCSTNTNELDEEIENTTSDEESSDEETSGEETSDEETSDEE